MHRNQKSPRERVRTYFDEESRVKQSCAPQCDINRIVARYRKTGVLEHLNENPSRYVDLSPAADYHSALNLVLSAEAAFADLPANIRNRFQNQPLQLLEFVNDVSNRDEMYELGLAVRPEPVEAGDKPPEKVADVQVNESPNG